MAEQNNQIVTFNYEGTPISFNRGDAVMVNATEMAKPFGKRPVDWLNLPSTKEFITELSNVRKSNISDFQPIITQQGSPVNGGGTWMHEDVAMEFAHCKGVTVMETPKKQKTSLRKSLFAWCV